jgi:hypothetical protein
VECQKETPCVAVLNKQNVIFFLLFFSYTKSENRRAEQVLPGEAGTGGSGEEGGNGEGGWI